MNIALQLLLGGMMIGITVIIHAVALDFIIKRAAHAENFFRRLGNIPWRPFMSSCIVLGVFLSHILHIWMWAGLFLFLKALSINTLANALYFSTVSYTTVGYGDIILKPEFHILSGIEAANGFLLFGWTTAFIFEISSRLYKREVKSL